MPIAASSTTTASWYAKTPSPRRRTKSPTSRARFCVTRPTAPSSYATTSSGTRTRSAGGRFIAPRRVAVAAEARVHGLFALVGRARRARDLGARAVARVDEPPRGERRHGLLVEGAPRRSAAPAPRPSRARASAGPPRCARASPARRAAGRGPRREARDCAAAAARRATTHDASAVHAPPRCRSPVGDGAKRVRTSPRPSPRRSADAVLRAEQPHEQRLLHVKPVLGLIPHARARALERGVVDLLAAVRGQAVQDDRLGLRRARASPRRPSSRRTPRCARRPRPPGPCSSTRRCSRRRSPSTALRRVVHERDVRAGARDLVGAAACTRAGPASTRWKPKSGAASSHERAMLHRAVADERDALARDAAPSVLLDREDVAEHLHRVPVVGERVDDRHARRRPSRRSRVVAERAVHDGVAVAREHARRVADRLAAAELAPLHAEHDRMSPSCAHPTSNETRVRVLAFSRTMATDAAREELRALALRLALQLRREREHLARLGQGEVRRASGNRAWSSCELQRLGEDALREHARANRAPRPFASASARARAATRSARRPTRGPVPPEALLGRDRRARDRARASDSRVERGVDRVRARRRRSPRSATPSLDGQRHERAHRLVRLAERDAAAHQRLGEVRRLREALVERAPRRAPRRTSRAASASDTTRAHPRASGPASSSGSRSSCWSRL